MAIQPGGRAPYAPTKAILRVVERHRQFGLRTMDQQKLKSIGVTDALAPRTLASLIGLGLYDGEGQITQEFEALRLAPEADFKPHLGELLRKAYSPILEILDPWTATRTEVEDAFRGFEPPGMRPRMVQLFEGLMIFTGLRPESQRVAGAGATGKPTAKPSGGKVATGRAPSRTQSGRHDGKPKDEPPSPPSPPVNGAAYERRDVTLGAAGSVSITVNVLWLDLSDDQFTKLRKLIKDIEALGDSGPSGDLAPAAGTAGASGTGENGTSGQADVLTGAGLPHTQ